MDEATYTSGSTNSLGKGVNPTILSAVKVNSREDLLFNLDMSTDFWEEKDWIPSS